MPTDLPSLPAIPPTSISVDRWTSISRPDYLQRAISPWDVLPAGGTCTFTPAVDFLELAEINVDMRLECQLGTYSATLSIDKIIGQTEFSTQGSTVLFHENDSHEVLILSVILAADPIRPPSPSPLINTESQTDEVKIKEAGTQARPLMRSQKLETVGRVVEEAALQEAVIRVVQVNIKKEKARRQRRAKPLPPPDPVQPLKQNLGWNVVPRLQKLNMLDQMISNRERLLEVLGATVQHSEVRKKMEFIRSQRRPDKDWTLTEKVAEEKGNKELGMELVEEREAGTEEKKESTAGTSHASTPFRSQEENESSSTLNQAKSSSTSDVSSSSSSKESSPRQPAPLKERASSSSIEDPFSPRPRRPAEKTQALSPTSEYIKTLREEILRQRMAK